MKPREVTKWLLLFSIASSFVSTDYCSDDKPDILGSSRTTKIRDTLRKFLPRVNDQSLACKEKSEVSHGVLPRCARVRHRRDELSFSRSQASRRANPLYAFPDRNVGNRLQQRFDAIRTKVRKAHLDLAKLNPIRFSRSLDLEQYREYTRIQKVRMNNEHRSIRISDYATEMQAIRSAQRSHTSRKIFVSRFTTGDPLEVDVKWNARAETTVFPETSDFRSLRIVNPGDLRENVRSRTENSRRSSVQRNSNTQQDERTTFNDVSSRNIRFGRRNQKLVNDANRQQNQNSIRREDYGTVSKEQLTVVRVLDRSTTQRRQNKTTPGVASTELMRRCSFLRISNVKILTRSVRLIEKPVATRYNYATEAYRNNARTIIRELMRNRRFTSRNNGLLRENHRYYRTRVERNAQFLSNAKNSNSRDEIRETPITREVARQLQRGQNRGRERNVLETTSWLISGARVERKRHAFNPFVGRNRVIFMSIDKRISKRPVDDRKESRLALREINGREYHSKTDDVGRLSQERIKLQATRWALEGNKTNIRHFRVKKFGNQELKDGKRPTRSLIGRNYKSSGLQREVSGQRFEDNKRIPNTRNSNPQKENVEIIFNVAVSGQVNRKTSRSIDLKRTADRKIVESGVAMKTNVLQSVDGRRENWKNTKERNDREYRLKRSVADGISIVYGSKYTLERHNSRYVDFRTLFRKTDMQRMGRSHIIDNQSHRNTDHQLYNDILSKELNSKYQIKSNGSEINFFGKERKSLSGERKVDNIRERKSDKNFNRISIDERISHKLLVTEIFRNDVQQKRRILENRITSSNRLQSIKSRVPHEVRRELVRNVRSGRKPRRQGQNEMLSKGINNERSFGSFGFMSNRIQFNKYHVFSSGVREIDEIIRNTDRRSFELSEREILIYKHRYGSRNRQESQVMKIRDIRNFERNTNIRLNMRSTEQKSVHHGKQEKLMSREARDFQRLRQDFRRLSVEDGMQLTRNLESLKIRENHNRSIRNIERRSMNQLDVRMKLGNRNKDFETKNTGRLSIEEQKLRTTRRTESRKLNKNVISVIRNKERISLSQNMQVRMLTERYSRGYRSISRDLNEQSASNQRMKPLRNHESYTRTGIIINIERKLSSDETRERIAETERNARGFRIKNFEIGKLLAAGRKMQILMNRKSSKSTENLPHAVKNTDKLIISGNKTQKKVISTERNGRGFRGKSRSSERHSAGRMQTLRNRERRYKMEYFAYIARNIEQILLDAESGENILTPEKNNIGLWDKTRRRVPVEYRTQSSGKTIFCKLEENIIPSIRYIMPNTARVKIQDKVRVLRRNVVMFRGRIVTRGRRLPTENFRKQSSKNVESVETKRERINNRRNSRIVDQTFLEIKKQNGSPMNQRYGRGFRGKITNFISLERNLKHGYNRNDLQFVMPYQREDISLQALLLKKEKNYVRFSVSRRTTERAFGDKEFRNALRISNNLRASAENSRKINSDQIVSAAKPSVSRNSHSRQPSFEEKRIQATRYHYLVQSLPLLRLHSNRFLQGSHKISSPTHSATRVRNVRVEKSKTRSLKEDGIRLSEQTVFENVDAIQAKFNNRFQKHTILEKCGALRFVSKPESNNFGNRLTDSRQIRTSYGDHCNAKENWNIRNIASLFSHIILGLVILVAAASESDTIKRRPFKERLLDALSLRSDVF